MNVRLRFVCTREGSNLESEKIASSPDEAGAESGNKNRFFVGYCEPKDPFRDFCSAPFSSK